MEVKSTAVKREGSGKKVKIMEVNSSTEAAKVIPNQIFPIDKPPHLRSKKPLLRIPVKDIKTREEMMEKLKKDSSGEQSVVVGEGEGGSSSSSSSSRATTSKESGGSGGSGEKESKRREKTEKAALTKESQVSTRGKPKTTPTTTPTATARATPTKPSTVPSVPRTSHQFSQDWHRLSPFPDTALHYLKTIPPAFFSSADLETNTLVEVAEVLSGEGVAPAQAAPYLSSLTASKGFSISVMFLEAEQKQVFLKLITKCKEVEGYETKMEELKSSMSLL